MNTWKPSTQLSFFVNMGALEKDPVEMNVV